MKAFAFDTEFTVYSIVTTKNSVGAYSEQETEIGTHKGKLDLINAAYSISAPNGPKELSKKIDALLICNDIAVEAGYIIVSNSVRYRVESVDRTTLRGRRTAHIEIELVQENA